MKKKCLAMLLALVMAAGFLTGTAFAASASGPCGNSAAWSYRSGTPANGAIHYNSVIPAQPNTPVFIDVPSWYAVEANWAAANGIAKGVGNNQFAPGDICTNAQILTFLWRAEGKPAAKAASPFTVASDYQGAVDWAYEQGMIGRSFVPGAYCTRANAVSYIWRTFDSESPGAGGGGFTDVSPNAVYADAVAWAVENGITNGYPGNIFLPNKTCSRGEIVTFLYRAYVQSL